MYTKLLYGWNPTKHPFRSHELFNPLNVTVPLHSAVDNPGPFNSIDAAGTFSDLIKLMPTGLATINSGETQPMAKRRFQPQSWPRVFVTKPCNIPSGKCANVFPGRQKRPRWSIKPRCLYSTRLSRVSALPEGLHCPLVKLFTVCTPGEWERRFSATVVWL